jgi:hypothetical protein
MIQSKSDTMVLHVGGGRSVEYPIPQKALNAKQLLTIASRREKPKWRRKSQDRDQWRAIVKEGMFVTDSSARRRRRGLGFGKHVWRASKLQEINNKLQRSIVI